MQANGTSTWPFVRDPQFNYVTMLLHGDGSAGANNGSGAAVTPTVTSFNADASTNNFNVIINGDARSNNFTPYQGNGYYGVSFNGSSDYLTTPQTSSLNIGTGTFTTEAWVYLNSKYTSGGTSIINLGNGANGGGPYTGWGLIIDYDAGSNTAYPAWYRYDGSVTQYTSSVSLNTGQWYHLAVARDASNNFAIWVNGARVYSGTSTVSFNNVNSDPLTIGRRTNGSANSPNWMNGYISNGRVVIGSNVYDPTQSTITVPTSPLTAVTNTQLLFLQSNNFVDNSSAARTITVAGGTPSVSPAIPFTLPTTVATYGSGYFDGSGDYLSAPNVPASGTGSFCFEAWIYPTNSSVNQMIIGAVNGGMWVGMNIDTANNFSIGRAFTANDNGVSFTWANNRWYHVAVNRNGTNLQFFVDGVQIGSTLTNSINYSVAGRLIAAEGTTPATFYSGYIAGLRVVNASVYTSAFTPPTAPPSVIANTTLLTTQYNGGGNNSGFKDSGPFNFPITRNGNTTQGTFTPYGSNWGNYFDGSTGYLSMASNAALNFGTGDATVEFWFNGNTASLLYPGIFSSIDYNSAGSASIRYNNTGYANKVFMYINTGGDPVISSTSTIAFGVWAHIAIVRQGTSLKLYLNGALDTTVTISSGLGFNLSNGGTRIGRGFDVDSTNGYFTGYLSNLRAVKGTAVYTSNFTPSTIPLTAISGTSLLTCQSNRFIDNSTNAFTLTVNGSPSVQRFSPFANATAYNPAVTGGSAYFDGNDYLTTPTTAAFAFSGNFTVEAWVYLTANIANSFGGYVTDFRGSSTNNFALGFIGAGGVTKMYAYIGVTPTDVTGSVTVAINAWNHVAYVRSGSTVTVYLNGVANGTLSTSYSQGSTSATICARYTGSTEYIQGYVSDLRVVNGTALYTSAFTPPPAPLTPIPSTQLLLSNTNAGIFDQSMMNDLETVGNASVSTSVVKYGTASMYFDGSGDGLNGVISPLFDFGSGSFTVEFWAYCVSTSGTGFFVSCWDNSGGSDANSSWLIRLDSGNVITHFMQGSGTYNTLTSTALSTNTWFHFAWVKNGTTQTMYINGTSVASGTVTGSMNTVIRSFKVGYQGAATNYLNGYIDDLRITKGYARYTTTFTPPTQALPNG
jgi:hypothetical protein